MINLSTVERSMTRALESNTTKINKCRTPEEVTSTVTSIFKDFNIDTPASNRLISNLKSSKKLDKSLFTVYNSMLAGENLTVLNDSAKKPKKEN
jgi:hypothetical protein